MAERRMFAKTIVLSDAFLDMPLSARCLYFTLGMFADDDGFVNSPKGIMRQCGASEDDMRILMTKKFLLSFESGVIVIKHWRINNYLRNDRYQETKYLEEKSELQVDENGAYTFGIPNSGIPSIDKDSIDKNRIGKDREITRASNFDAERAWKDTLDKYPKKSAAVMAKQRWMEMLVDTPEPNRKDVAVLIFNAIKLYLLDYEKNNPDDKDFHYIPKLHTWFEQDCGYWITKAEEWQREASENA